MILSEKAKNYYYNFVPEGKWNFYNLFLSLNLKYFLFAYWIFISKNKKKMNYFDKIIASETSLKIFTTLFDNYSCLRCILKFFLID